MVTREEEKWCSFSYVSLTLAPVHTQQTLGKAERLHTRGALRQRDTHGERGRAALSSALGRSVDLVAQSGAGYSLFAFMFFAELLCEGVIICW